MFVRITINSIIEGAAKNLVNDLREWNKNTLNANNPDAPECQRTAYHNSAEKVAEICKYKVRLLEDMGLKIGMKVNQRGYVEGITIDDVEFDVITDSFADNCYR